MPQKFLTLMCMVVMVGCASIEGFDRHSRLDAPAEFDQTVEVVVGDKYKMYQAPSASADIGDLAAFHVQHVLPMHVQAAFEEMFGNVVLVDASEPRVTIGLPEEAASFEVKITDISHDLFNPNSDTFRSAVTLAAAMKSPQGSIFWRKAFRGEGEAFIRDSSFGINDGPAQAVDNALYDALGQMQDAILSSSQVKLQLKYYKDIAAARNTQESTT